MYHIRAECRYNMNNFFKCLSLTQITGLWKEGVPCLDVIIYWGSYPVWWRHQMETFSALPALCARNSPVTGEFPAQRPVTRSFGVFFDLRLNKRLSKQSWGWWFETPSCSLWRHCKVYMHSNKPCTCRLKSPATRLFVDPFVQANIRGTINALIALSLCEGNPPVTGGFP